MRLHQQRLQCPRCVLKNASATATRCWHPTLGRRRWISASSALLRISSVQHPPRSRRGRFQSRQRLHSRAHLRSPLGSRSSLPLECERGDKGPVRRMAVLRHHHLGRWTAIFAYVGQQRVSELRYEPSSESGRRSIRRHAARSHSVVQSGRVPAPFLFGYAGRNSLRGPGLFSADWALSKNFVLTERFNLRFSWEAYNSWNNTNLSLPNNNVDAQNAGQISSITSPMRNMQFGLRLGF